MNINEFLSNDKTNLDYENQKNFFEEMKNKSFFEITGQEKENFIDFLCEKSYTELTIDYLFHVLDNEVSYPIDEEQINSLFSDERMLKFRDLMLEILDSEQDEDLDDENVENFEENYSDSDYDEGDSEDDSEDDSEFDEFDEDED